ncbi:MAG: hypothetical protein ACI4XM_05340 [Candidatus Coprovivens sp.]
MHLLKVMLIISLILALALIILFIFCSCILAKRADNQKIELLKKE